MDSARTSKRQFVKFDLEDFVQNKVTQEDGRVVRIVELAGPGCCYIVLVVPNPATGTSAREVLWQQSEMTLKHHD
jgi:hypothetical protein